MENSWVRPAREAAAEAIWSDDANYPVWRTKNEQKKESRKHRTSSVYFVPHVSQIDEAAGKSPEIQTYPLPSSSYELTSIRSSFTRFAEMIARWTVNKFSLFMLGGLFSFIGFIAGGASGQWNPVLFWISAVLFLLAIGEKMDRRK